MRALRRRYPDAHLSYLVEPLAAPIIRTNPHVSEVIVAPYRRGWRRVVDDLRLASRLRRSHFDLVIDLHGGPRSASLAWSTRAARRVGYDVPGRSWMYTDVVHRPRELRARHSVVNQWDLLAVVDPAFAAAPDPDRDRTEMPADPAARARVDARLAALGVTADDRLVVLHVSAGNPFRRWPETAFADVTQAIVTHDARRWVLVTGGPSDAAAAARVMADARARAGQAGVRILDAEGWPLDELRALFDRASLFIGGDSGPLHIASTSDVPIVGLYGPTPVARSVPWRPASIPTLSVDAGPLPCRPCDQKVCAPGDFRCLSGIPAARVIASAEQMLEVAG